MALLLVQGLYLATRTVRCRRLDAKLPPNARLHSGTSTPRVGPHFLYADFNTLNNYIKINDPILVRGSRGDVPSQDLWKTSMYVYALPLRRCAWVRTPGDKQRNRM